MKVTIGIDPGLDGGYAILGDGAAPIVAALPWRDKELDAQLLLRVFQAFFRPRNHELVIVIEKVHAMPKQGTTSMFTFGSGFGELKAVVKIVGCPWVLVTPQAWKKLVLAGTDKSKGATVSWAFRTYPSLTTTLTKKSGLPHMGKVDALAIAHYGHHLHAR